MSGGTGEGTATVTLYVPDEQYAVWKEDAADFDMSVSEYGQSMIQAGRRKFDARDVEPDVTNRELREQRNDLRVELEHARERISRLESRIHDTERDEIRRFVRDNPGAEFAEIAQRVANTAGRRTGEHLDDMMGEMVYQDDAERYWPEDPEQ